MTEAEVRGTVEPFAILSPKIQDHSKPVVLPKINTSVNNSKLSPDRQALYKSGDALKAGVEKYEGDTAISKYALALTYNTFSKNKINLKTISSRCRVSSQKIGRDGKPVPSWGLTDAELNTVQDVADQMIVGIKAADSIWYKEHPVEKPILNLPEDNGKITVNVNPETHTLTEHSNICTSAIIEVYNKPLKRVFVRNGQLSNIRYDEKCNVKISDVSRDGLRNILDLCCNFIIYEKLDGEFIIKKARPSRDICENILASNTLSTSLPPLFGMTEAPYITSDGIVVTAPGYNDTTALYFAPDKDYKKIIIQDAPTKEDVTAAVKHIDDLFQDFQFEDNAGKENAFAAILTSVLRPTIDGCTPMYLVDKPQMGTGGSLVCEIINRIATGKPLEPSNAPKDNNPEEWEKLVVSILQAGTPSVCFDNIESNFKSSSLASVLTSRSKKCRILGTTNHTSFNVNVNWMGNGINLNVQGDMPRRIYLSRLVTDSARPQARTDFKIPNIKMHVLEHRYEYLKDVLTIAKAFFNAGKPKAEWHDPVTQKLKTIPMMGSFEEWRDFIGGIMVFIGKTDFLSNTETVLRDCESQSSDDEMLLERISFVLGEKEFTAKDIIDDSSMRFDDFLPSYIATEEKGKAKKLGKHFVRIRGRVYPSGYKLVFSRETSHVQRWIVKLIPQKFQQELTT